MNISAPARLRGLDTLRATAILAVMMFHVSSHLPPALANVGYQGWIGVDLFFVLSGYLISTQLLRSVAHGKPVSIPRFYSRRAFRILPAYFAVLALYIFVPLWREADGMQPVWQFLTFTENLFVDYSKNRAFSHVWSLCVEEHFYLLLPLMVVLLARKPSARKTILVLSACVLAGIAVRTWFLFHTLRPLGPDNEAFSMAYIERIYYPTYSRLDGLLAGVALALVRIFKPTWWTAVAHRGQTLLLSAVALIAFALYLFWDRFGSATGAAAVSSVIGFPLLSAGLALMVASALSHNGWLARIRIPGAQLISTLAFSLYLTHKEIVHLDQRFFPQITDNGGLIAFAFYGVTSLAGAGVLYLCVERPFLLLRDHLEHRKTSAALADLEGRREPAL